MKSTILLCVATMALTATASNAIEKRGESAQAMQYEPQISLQEALALAEQYVSANKIDTSQHFIESIRLVHITETPQEERRWIVTWALKKERTDGGQIFVTVKMDRTVSMIRGM